LSVFNGFVTEPCWLYSYIVKHGVSSWCFVCTFSCTDDLCYMHCHM